MHLNDRLLKCSTLVYQCWRGLIYFVLSLPLVFYNFIIRLTSIFGLLLLPRSVFRKYKREVINNLPPSLAASLFSASCYLPYVISRLFSLEIHLLFHLAIQENTYLPVSVLHIFIKITRTQCIVCQIIIA